MSGEGGAMSGTGQRKSMEDVLAAIRRIVRNERAPESVQTPDPDVVPAAALSPRFEPDAVDDEDEDEDEAPLTLTPDMRHAPSPAPMGTPALDTTFATLVQPLVPEAAPVPTAPVLPPPADMTPTPTATAVAVAPIEAVEDAVVIDEAALEDMVRRIVRDELMGEMGIRMTKNVTRLIQDEVARALAARG